MRKHESILHWVDVETYTGDYEADIRADGQGLDYLLAMCGQYGVAGTFFVEVRRVAPGGRWSSQNH